MPLAELLDEQWPWCREHGADLERLFAAYGEAKLQQQSLDFDDLLLSWWLVMQVPEMAARIGSRFDHVLVDEVQDVNRLQADIAQALKPQRLRPDGGRRRRPVDLRLSRRRRAPHPRLAAALHAAGAGAHAGAQLPLDAGDPGSVQCRHRAGTGTLCQAALERPRRRPCPPRLVTVADEAAQARGVADAVLAQREAGLALKRQAVLFRTATHSAALELELVRRGIPFVKYGGLRFLEAAHVKDVLAVLRWADNPASQLAALRTARLVPGMGPASVRRLLGHAGPLARFKPPPAAAAPWAALVALHGTPARRCGGLARRPVTCHRLVPAAPGAPVRRRPRAPGADLEQLAHIAAGQRSRERFITELTLDPPEASSDEAGPPLRDEDYLILSTIHSAKGQEWNAVHVLNVVDGCLPADMATGRGAEIEEERRLLYVAMTRARDELTLWVPQRFHVTQQRAWGDRHLYALRSRFIPDTLLPHFEVVCPVPPEDTAVASDGASATPLIDLAARLRHEWAVGAGSRSGPAPAGIGQEPA